MGFFENINIFGSKKKEEKNTGSPEQGMGNQMNQTPGAGSDAGMMGANPEGRSPDMSETPDEEKSPEGGM